MSKIIHFLNLCDDSLMDGGENAGVGAQASEGASPSLCLGFPLCRAREGPVARGLPVSAPALCGSRRVTALAPLGDLFHEQMLWFVQKTLRTSFQRWVVVNTGYSDDEK